MNNQDTASTNASVSNIDQLIQRFTVDSTPMTTERIEMIGKIAFGNAKGKEAIAETNLIPRMISCRDGCELRTFVKTIKACVVNCSQGREKCRNRSLFVYLVDNLRMDPDEIITTLCAICINDNDNALLLKGTLEERNIDLNRFVHDNSELEQKVAFLYALMT